MKNSFTYKGETLFIYLNQYCSNNALALQLTTEFEPYAAISVNLEGDSDILPRDCFYAKHWGGQEPIIQAMLDQGVIEKTNFPEMESGFVNGIKAYKLSDEYKTICGVCENWVFGPNNEMFKCKNCDALVCKICGDINLKLCDMCFEELFDDDEEEFEEDDLKEIKGNNDV